MNKSLFVYFGDNFNQPIIIATGGTRVSLLANNTTNLKFGNAFNQSIDILPDTITDLSFGEDFNQPLDKAVITHTGITKVSILPKSLEVLHIGGYNFGSFNYPIDNLPESLESIFIVGIFNQSVNNLPNKLRSLLLDKSGFNKPLDKLVQTSQGNISVSILPNSLVVLKLGYGYDQQINALPPNLRRLIIPYSYKYITQLKNILPETVKLLELTDTR